MRPKTLSFARDSTYGAGVCTRDIVIAASTGSVFAHLSDPFHELKCRIIHDGRTVTAIEGEAVRIPTSACPAAAGMLADLVGTRLGLPIRELYRGHNAGEHCTHLFDLSVVAIRHAFLPPSATLYEATVPDETDSPVVVSIRRNGVVVHAWEVLGGQIVSPARYRGNTLGRGFATWAAANFDNADLEAATILARTWLIAIGRRYLTEGSAGQSITQNGEMIGRCFAYSPKRAATAVFTEGQRRDAPAPLRQSIALPPLLADN